MFNIFKRDIPYEIAPNEESLAQRIKQMEAGVMNTQQLLPDLNTGEALAKGFGGHDKNLDGSRAGTKYITNIKTVQGRTYRERYQGGESLIRILKAASKNPVVDAIIRTRASQVAAFGAPARYSNDSMGFVVEVKDKKANSELTKQELKEIKEIEDFLNQTGSEVNPDENFRSWLRKVVRDTLVYDQTNTEITYDEKGKPIRFIPVDASTIKIAVNSDGSKPRKGANKYVQVVDNEISVGYKDGEITFDVMNPRTDIRSFKQGLSPLEISLDEVSYHDSVVKYNSMYFSQGGTTMGILQIKTGDTRESMAALQDFRNSFTNMAGGLNGAWKIPVVSAEDVKFVPMNQSSKDLEFEKWINLLINTITSTFNIDPAEIGYMMGKGATGANSSGSLNEASKKEAAELSKSRGLKPILDFIEDIVNVNIMTKFYDGKYIFHFKGDDLSSELRQLEVLKQKLSTYMTVNEVRAQHNLEPIRGGDTLLDGPFIQAVGQTIAEDMNRSKTKEKPGLEGDIGDDEPSFQDKQKLAYGKVDTNLETDTKKNGIER